VAGWEEGRRRGGKVGGRDGEGGRERERGGSVGWDIHNPRVWREGDV